MKRLLLGLGLTAAMVVAVLLSGKQLQRTEAPVLDDRPHRYYSRLEYIYDSPVTLLIRWDPTKRPPHYIHVEDLPDGKIGVNLNYPGLWYQHGWSRWPNADYRGTVHTYPVELVFDRSQATHELTLRENPNGHVSATWRRL